MPSKESLDRVLPMVCKRLQWSEETPSGWANAVADLLDEAIREAALREAEWWRYQTHEGAICSPQDCEQCKRVAGLREGKP